MPYRARQERRPPSDDPFGEHDARRLGGGRRAALEPPEPPTLCRGFRAIRLAAVQGRRELKERARDMLSHRFFIRGMASLFTSDYQQGESGLRPEGITLQLFEVTNCLPACDGDRRSTR